jgi:hypothetical protein
VRSDGLVERPERVFEEHMEALRNAVDLDEEADVRRQVLAVEMIMLPLAIHANSNEMELRNSLGVATKRRADLALERVVEFEEAASAVPHQLFRRVAELMDGTGRKTCGIHLRRRRAGDADGGLDVLQGAVFVFGREAALGATGGQAERRPTFFPRYTMMAISRCVSNWPSSSRCPLEQAI